MILNKVEVYIFSLHKSSSGVSS